MKKYFSRVNHRAPLGTDDRLAAVCHGRSVEGSQVEVELQDGEGDIQTIWLNIKEETASVLQRLGTCFLHITLLPGVSGLGKLEPFVKPQAHDISRKYIHKRPGQVFAACHFPFTLAGHTPIYTTAP